MPFFLLKFPRRDVVHAGDAENDARGVLFPDPIRAAADDDAGFGLVIDATHARWNANRLARADDGGRRLDEDQRLGRQRLSLLGGMRAIVQPHRDDLRRQHGREHARAVEAALEPHAFPPIAEHVAYELAYLAVALDDVFRPGAGIDSKESRHQRAVSST